MSGASFDTIAKASGQNTSNAHQIRTNLGSRRSSCGFLSAEKLFSLWYGSSIRFSFQFLPYNNFFIFARNVEYIAAKDRSLCDRSFAAHLAEHRKLVLDVWHQSHKARSLYCFGKVPLPFCSHASTTSVHHTSVWIHVCLQASDVFVVNVVVDGRLLSSFSHDVFIMLIKFLSILHKLCVQFSKRWDIQGARRRRKIVWTGLTSSENYFTELQQSRLYIFNV